jgi:hypothetical protein
MSGRRLLVGLLTLLMPLAGASAETKRIFAIPPTQWDSTMSRDRPAQIHGPSDLANLTGGIVFGLSPSEVNAKLATPMPEVEWAGLPSATEYPDDVRYLWVRLDTARDLRDAIQSCMGAGSYVVFLFRARGLFRISWRLLPDTSCPSTRLAAEDIYARYLAIDRAAALALHYHAGNAEAVEITDPNADYLLPYRWANRRPR